MPETKRRPKRIRTSKPHAAPGTTNAEHPFEPGEIIIYMRDRFEVRRNDGEEGVVRQFGGDFDLDQWGWEWEGEVCRRA